MGEIAVPAGKAEATKESIVQIRNAAWKLRAMASLFYHDRGKQQDDLTLDASAAEGVSLMLDQLADEIVENSDNISDSIREWMKGETNDEKDG